MKYVVVAISTTAQPDIEDSPYLSWASKKGADTPEEAFSRAGMHAEYGMVCALSAYTVKFDGDMRYSMENVLKITSDNLEDEEALLLTLESTLQRLGKDVVLVGHNIKDFIVPFLAKRYLGRGLRIPVELVAAMKGNVIDIMKELACGGQSVMSLRSSAWLLGVNDQYASRKTPRIYELVKNGMMDEVVKYTDSNARTAAGVFADCVLGGLIEAEEAR